MISRDKPPVSVIRYLRKHSLEEAVFVDCLHDVVYRISYDWWIPEFYLWYGRMAAIYYNKIGMSIPNVWYQARRFPLN